MASVQRSTFLLVAGLNRPGDPTDDIVPSAPRLLPKGADNTGAQVSITFDDLGSYTFNVAIEGTNEPSATDPSVPDLDASWILAGLPSTVFEDGDTDARMLGGVDQVLTLAPFLFIRANLIGDVSLSDADNLEVSVHVKTDYETG